jgi:hypothetical protein
MNVSDLKSLLAAHPAAPLHIALPWGEAVPEHFHVTEVGRVQKDFIDCGGTKRQQVSCVLQVWVADDVNHRLVSDKLAKIMKLSESVVGDDSLGVEIEFGQEYASNFYLDSAWVADENGITFVLTPKKTDCLAPDKCGITQCRGSGCC